MGLLDDLGSGPTLRLGGRLSGALVELLDRVYVDRVDLGTVVGQKRGKRAANNFGAVDDGDSLAVEAVAVGKVPIVDADGLETLDHGQRCAGQDGFSHTRRNLLAIEGLTGRTLLGELACGTGSVAELGRRNPSHVVVHVPAVAEVKTLNILAWVDNLLEVGVLTTKEDGVVDHDTVHLVIRVGSDDEVLNIGFEVKVGCGSLVVLFLDLDRVVPGLPDLEFDANGLTGLARPFGVGYTGRARSGKNTDELGSGLALIETGLDGLLDGILVRSGDAGSLDKLAGVLGARHRAGLGRVLDDGFRHAASYATKHVVGLYGADRVALAVKGVDEVGSRKLVAGLQVADSGTVEGVKKRVELGLSFGTDVRRLAEGSFASESRGQRKR